MTNTELKKRGLTDEEIKYLKLWVEMGYGINVEIYLKYKTLGVKEVKRIKEGASIGWVFSFYFIIFVVGIQNLFFGLGEFDPFKMKIAFAIGLVGSIYYGYEYFQHKKFLKEIEKVIKLTFF